MSEIIDLLEDGLAGLGGTHVYDKDDAISKTAQAIDDFYRNKILEAKVNLLEHLMTSNPQYTYEAAKDILIDLKSTKDAITAQSQSTKQESR